MRAFTKKVHFDFRPLAPYLFLFSIDISKTSIFIEWKKKKILDRVFIFFN